MSGGSVDIGVRRLGVRAVQRGSRKDGETQGHGKNESQLGVDGSPNGRVDDATWHVLNLWLRPRKQSATDSTWR